MVRVPCAPRGIRPKVSRPSERSRLPLFQTQVAPAAARPAFGAKAFEIPPRVGSRVAADKAASLGGESPLPSVA